MLNRTSVHECMHMHTCIKVAPDAGMQNYAYSVVANNVCQSDACGGENNGVAPPTGFWLWLFLYSAPILPMHRSSSRATL